ncbi:hypothetical protein Emed_003800 [Eimeria media]
MSAQADKHLANNGVADGLSSSKLQALRLFDARTPRTSASVRGRWTAEFQVIKAALLRQRTAKNKALRGPTTCSCCHTKELPGHSTGFASAAAHASKAFAEVARLTPRSVNDKKPNATLWGLGLVASSDAAAAEAAAATEALQESNAWVRRPSKSDCYNLSLCCSSASQHSTKNRRRLLLTREGGLGSFEGPAAHPPPPPTRVPAFLWKEYFDTPISRAALSYREAAKVVLPPARTRQALRGGSCQPETDSHQQDGRQKPPASFFLTAPNPPATEATALPATPVSAESARRRSSSHPAKILAPLSASSANGVNSAQQKSSVGGQQQKKGVSDAAATADASSQQSKGAHGKTTFPGSIFWRKSVEPSHLAKAPAAGKAKTNQVPAADDNCQESLVRSLAAELLQKLTRARGSCLESSSSSDSRKRGRSEERIRTRGVFQRSHHSVEVSSQQIVNAAIACIDAQREDCFAQQAAQKAETQGQPASLCRGLFQVDATRHPEVGRLPLHEVHQSCASSCISSSRRLPTLQEFIDGQRHLKAVASEAAEGKPQDLTSTQLLSSCLVARNQGSSVHLATRLTSSSIHILATAKFIVIEQCMHYVTAAGAAGIPKTSFGAMQSESPRVGSNSASNSPSSGNGTASQPSVKLEKLLAEADEAFWVSHKLDHMVGFLSNRTRRATSAGRRRRSSFNFAAAAGRGTLSPEVLQQQLQQLIARSAPAGGRPAGADAQQANKPETAASLSRQRIKSG